MRRSSDAQLRIVMQSTTGEHVNRVDSVPLDTSVPERELIYLMLSRRTTPKNLQEGASDGVPSHSGSAYYRSVSNPSNKYHFSGCADDKVHFSGISHAHNSNASPLRGSGQQCPRRLNILHFSSNNDKMCARPEATSRDSKHRTLLAKSQDMVRVVTMRVRHTESRSRSFIRMSVFYCCVINASIGLLIACMMWRRHVTFMIVAEKHRWDVTQKIHAFLWSSFYYFVTAVMVYSNYIIRIILHSLGACLHLCSYALFSSLSCVHACIMHVKRHSCVAAVKVTLCSAVGQLLSRLGMSRRWRSASRSDRSSSERNVLFAISGQGDGDGGYTRGYHHPSRLRRLLRTVVSGLQCIWMLFTNGPDATPSRKTTSTKRGVKAYPNRHYEYGSIINSLELSERRSTLPSKQRSPQIASFDGYV